MIDPYHPNYQNTPVSSARPVYPYQPVESSALPTVTIITPFYNVGPVFHQTAASVLRQSFQQWEWLIVNDASTQTEALAVLNEYRDCDPRVRVIDVSKNGGPGAARNAGIQAARCKYIANVDADDLLEPTAIEKWAWFLDAHPEYAFVKGYTVAFGEEEFLWPKGFQHGSAFLEANQTNPNGMVRVSLYQALGGYDETIRAGLEDWDFWLRCAHAGYWGATIPEYLDWYRRRESHTDRWADWDTGARQQHFHATLRRKYSELWTKGFPRIARRPHLPHADVPSEIPFRNALAKSRPRLLCVFPWLTMGGADKFNLDLLQQLEQIGWEVTIATTLVGNDIWLPEFAKFTPDIFVLHHFLPLVDYPRFLRYLIQSRQIDAVLISHSYLGYSLLSYLRAYCPGVTFLDYLHIEEEYWKNGGYPRASLNHAEQLDLTVVSSQHLKDWMVARGGQADQLEVCTTNIDCADWDPTRYERLALRRALSIDPETPVILYAGRLDTQKQPQVFAEVMHQLAQSGLGFVCLVAGDGKDRAFLERFVHTHHLAQVRLLGSVSNQRMRELMAVSDIFFLPSQMEGISLAIYEAMAMGVVPVSADVGGQRELVTPECGLLVARTPTEGDAYVEALTQLISNPDRRHLMGQCGRQRVNEHFRLEQMGERIVTLIRHAQQRALESPRPALSPGLGQEIATHVVEFTRLEQMADQLWLERQTMLAGKPAPENLGRYMVLWVGRRLKERLRPIYRWAVTHGMKWLVPFRNWVYRLVMRWVHPRSSASTRFE